MTNQKSTMAGSQAHLHDHKARLRTYFDGTGFERWSAIYGQARLSSVRHSIREGHAAMLAQAGAWLDDYALPANAQALDAGCGTGLFTVAMAKRGLTVTSVDIAPQMVRAATAQAEQAGVRDRIRFLSGDLESVGGSFDVVACFDVLIHYPQAGFVQLCTRLASLSRGVLFLTYAPYNRVLATMHWIGGHFPKSERRTDIQMIPDSVVHQTLASAGMSVRRSVRVGKGFYHVMLLEARPIAADH